MRRLVSGGVDTQFLSSRPVARVPVQRASKFTEREICREVQ